MVDFIEGLEDWGIKEAVNAALGSLVADGTITISVADDGPGISATDQGRVFDRFFRADAVRGSSVHGSGLGLSISRDIARAHGGELLLSESPDGGLRATIKLPV